MSRFQNYVALSSTGLVEDGEDLYIFEQVRARFVGMEASSSTRLSAGASTLDLALRGDVVRASNLSSGEALPRIAPWRVGASLIWGSGAWGAKLDVDRAGAQNRVPEGDTATAAYTLLNLSGTYRVKAGASNLLWYARLDNLTDTLAYSASSVLTSTAFGKAPLPGRSLRLGLQASF